MASGDTLQIFTPAHNVPPSSNYATFDVRQGHLVLDFDDSTGESADFPGVLPENYAGGGLDVELHWSATDTTVGPDDVVWNVQIEAIGDDDTDTDSDSFAAANAVTDTEPSASGELSYATVSFTDGADMDSLAAGEAYRLRITRDVDNGSDDLAGDAELHRVVVKET